MMDEFPVFEVPADKILKEEEFEQLYTASTEIIVILSIFYGAISLFAVIGNTLVIWVVVTTRNMRTVTNMYIANLAFADVVIGLFCIPFQEKVECHKAHHGCGKMYLCTNKTKTTCKYSEPEIH